ncbi:MAG TPA: hypothetical protein VEC37_08825, partial [Bacillota bacterium]|nr:hypothetical protein [Bacillota bacterium]
MFIKRRLGLIAILLLFTFFITLSFANAALNDQVVIKMVTPFKPGHIIADASEAFKMLVQEETAGRITIQLNEGYGSEISC